MTKDYAAKGVAVVAISVSREPTDSLEKMKTRARERGFNFVYLQDPTQDIGRRYGATRTPQGPNEFKKMEPVKAELAQRIEIKHSLPKIVDPEIVIRGSLGCRKCGFHGLTSTSSSRTRARRRRTSAADTRA